LGEKKETTLFQYENIGFFKEEKNSVAAEQKGMQQCIMQDFHQRKRKIQRVY